MLISYLVLTVLIGTWISFIWSSNGAANCLIKTIFSIWTIGGWVMLLSVVWPYIQSGQVKLI